MTAKALCSKCCLLFILLLAALSGKAQLVANFTGTPLSGCTPLVVTFSDQSTGNPIQWRWDLGNGTISFLQNPSATYFSPGQYNIKLVIQNAAGTQDSIIKNQYINVYALPTINFTGSPLSGCFPLPVQFTDASNPGSGTISSWLWDFGDGNTGNTQNPAHTYTSAGNYNVTLQVTNSFGCSKTLTKSQYIQVSTGVTANFVNTQQVNCNPPETIQFTSQATGSGTLSYQWNFGDGGTSTLPNPSHTYLATGSYTVTLIVTSTTGCSDTLVRPAAVVISSPDASFTSADSVCVGSPLAFTNTSFPTPISSNWSFGDGTFSTLVNPVKIYSTSGNYQVRLLSGFGGCADSAFKNITVLPKPVVNFTAPVRTSCKPPFTVNFVNNSIGGSSYLWEFGDGATSTQQNPSHTYNSYGSFTVKLIVSTSEGCVDSLVIPDFVIIQDPQTTIQINPTQGCAPLNVAFNALVNSIDPVISYQWDLGNGNTSTSPNPVSVYNAGVYNISLIVTTAGGCADTVLMPGGVAAGNRPTPNFGATPRLACARQNIEFSDSSLGGITQWFWQFGDGSTSTVPNPSHKYNDTGYFSVTLTVWSNGCPDSITFTNYIYIDPPIALFDYTFNCANPRTISFTNNSIGDDEWKWYFGDGDTSILPNPIHTYADTGTYTVMLRVFNFQTGCDDTAFAQIRIVSALANFFANDTAICRYDSTRFYAAGIKPGTITSYAWDLGDGSTSSDSAFWHQYLNPGLYTIKLVITDISGCKDSLTKQNYIRVDGPEAAFSVQNGGGCLSTGVVFTDNSIPDGINPIAQWIWDFGDGNIQSFNASPFTHNYAMAGNYLVKLRVIDSQGCFDTTNNAVPIVVSRPVAGFISPDSITCPNGPIRFTNQSVGPGITYSWDFGDGGSSTQQNPVHNYASDGIYTVKLIITDQYGCIDSLVRPNYIRISTPRASFTISDSLSTCPPLIVTFNNTSVNASGLFWDFGDGSSSTAANPIHIYNNPGTFIVKLRIAGPGGICSDSAFKTIVVRGPRGSFTYGPLNGCSPHTINIRATTQDRLSFIWDLNDGTTFSSTDSILSHTYTRPGVYIPRMILVDAGGCQVPIQGIDTVQVRGVNAKFGFNGNPICDSGIIQFTDSSFSNDGFASFNWAFGDGNFSNLQNPAHFYASPGQYFPELIVITQSGCRDTARLPVSVKIVASPVADFNNSPNGCVPVTINFNGLLTIPDTSAISWSWNFDNGNTSTLQNPPSQTYLNAQVYNVQLIAVNSTGCRDTVNKPVEAYPIPAVSASADAQICLGNNTPLIASGANNYVWSPPLGLSCSNCPNPMASPDVTRRYYVTGTTLFGCSNFDSLDVTVIQPFTMNNNGGDTICIGGNTRLFATGASTYLWLPAAGLNSASSPTPIASPTASTTYRVVGYDAYGCFTDTGYARVEVYPIPTVQAGNDVTIRNGETTVLSPSISSDVTQVQWVPINSIVSYNLPSVTVKPKETTEYTVLVENEGGCKASDRVMVYVLCDGKNIFIPNTFSPNGDGSNDVFYVRGNGLFAVKHLRIFSRWGELIFERNNVMPNDVNAGWDGSYKGKALNADIFVYTAEIICENSTVLVLKGNVALLR